MGSSIITIVIALIVFGVVVLIHELGHFLTAKACGITVNEFSIGMGPRLFGFSKNGTDYSIRLLPIGGYVMMEGENEESDEQGSFQKAAVWKRILVTVAGAVMNLVLGFVILMGVVLSQQAILSRTVGEFYPDAATERQGLQVGDTILAVNGRRCFIANDISYEFARTQNATVDLTVLRDGKRVQLEDVVFDTQTQDGVSYMVLDFKVYPLEKTVGNVLAEAGRWTLSYARMVALSLADVVTGRVPVNNLSGPVGIVQVIGEATGMGWQPLMLLVALITVNLGVFNLLPIPALDGGRLVFLILEAIRRKPIPQKYEIAVNAAGFVFLIGLMLFATFNDVTKLLPA